MITVLTLAIAIGANTAIFSIMDGLLFRDLPVQDPRHLMLLRWSAHKRPNYHSSSSYGDCISKVGGDNPSGCSFSHPFYEDLRDHAASFSSIAAFGGGGQLNVSGQASPRHDSLGKLFSTLGVGTALGRPLEPGDDNPATPPAAVLSYVLASRFQRIARSRRQDDDFRARFNVTSDGQKFLIPSAAGRGGPAVATVIVKWMSAR